MDDNIYVIIWLDDIIDVIIWPGYNSDIIFCIDDKLELPPAPW